MAVALATILEEARSRVETAKRTRSLEELSKAARAMDGEPFRFRQALTASAETGIAVIAELKKASPSRGLIRGSFPVSRLAMQLAEGGAAALSVLTEELHFQGSLANLAEAAAASGLPCLRKDFLVDEYQLFEAKLSGAAAVLLIASALSGPEMDKLFRRARDLGLDVLCEVHDEQELARAVAVGADIIGVNSRDLKTMAVDRNTLFRLAPLIPKNILRVAESGIKTGADVRELYGAGYRAFLIGEALMSNPDPGLALAQLIAQAKVRSGAFAPSSWPRGTKD
jgi:indole-3-glycerol phosphate synthase